jgi:teichuronic acid biosynthesis glycosyltransferase TuaG
MVSIIIPVYNCEQFLETCIDSVLKQTFKEWEIILIDDCSSDNSKAIIKRYAALDSRIKFHFFDINVGAGIARNKGIELSEKRFIAFLDSDDYWHNDKLRLQLDFMIKNDISFSYTRYFELDKNNHPSKIILSPKSITSSQLKLNNYIKTLTVIYDTKVCGKIYMPEYRKRQDWGLWFNILKKTNKAYCLTKPLAYYRTSNDSLSKNKFLLLNENYNFYRGFFNKSIISSYRMMFFFILVHLYFKRSCYKTIPKNSINFHKK